MTHEVYEQAAMTFEEPQEGVESPLANHIENASENIAERIEAVSQRLAAMSRSGVEFREDAKATYREANNKLGEAYWNANEKVGEAVTSTLSKIGRAGLRAFGFGRKGAGTAKSGTSILLKGAAYTGKVVAGGSILAAEGVYNGGKATVNAAGDAAEWYRQGASNDLRTVAEGAKWYGRGVKEDYNRGVDRTKEDIQHGIDTYVAADSYIQEGLGHIEAAPVVVRKLGLGALRSSIDWVRTKVDTAHSNVSVEESRGHKRKASAAARRAARQNRRNSSNQDQGPEQMAA